MSRWPTDWSPTKWRGRPIESPRGDKTVRVVFIGASTTGDSDYAPFSWPKFVGHWPNIWADPKGQGVHFEVLDAAREGMNSTDITAIVRTEVMPLRPDLVVYYEGSNQFRQAAIVDSKLRELRKSLGGTVCALTNSGVRVPGGGGMGRQMNRYRPDPR
jgi:hypothetical protein